MERTNQDSLFEGIRSRSEIEEEERNEKYKKMERRYIRSRCRFDEGINLRLFSPVIHSGHNEGFREGSSASTKAFSTQIPYNYGDYIKEGKEEFVKELVSSILGCYTAEDVQSVIDYETDQFIWNHYRKPEDEWIESDALNDDGTKLYEKEWKADWFIGVGDLIEWPLEDFFDLSE